jgi:hypothetical protein
MGACARPDSHKRLGSESSGKKCMPGVDKGEICSRTDVHFGYLNIR